MFAFLRFTWVKKSNIQILMQKEELLFAYRDIGILGGIAILIVITAVIMVVVGNKEREL